MTESSRSKTCHAMARAEDILTGSGWTVLRRHSAQGHQEIFASKAINASRVWFARIGARSAKIYGGDLDCAVDRSLGKSAPDDSARAIVEMGVRDAAGGAA